jgi:hypothetical protein
MGQIIVTRKDGATTYPLMSRQSNRTITRATQSFQLLGQDLVKISVESSAPIDFCIGDYIVVFGRMYTLNRLPELTKNGASSYAYNAEFEGTPYEMMRAIFELSINTTSNELQDVQSDSLTGDLHRFATVVIANLNRAFPNKWILGTCPESEAKDTTLTFGETDNCLSVAQMLCDEFKVEMDIEYSADTDVRTLNFIDKVGTTLDMSFQYGRGRGLYQLTRNNVDSSNIITRLKVYGSTENITSKYRANRLCLPGKSKTESYIENADAISNYGLYEACKYFDDIKPTFPGQVTNIDEDNELIFIDTNMFDLNAKDDDGNTLYLLSGTPAKIHFNTGNLAGYEFEIAKYEHASHQFTLKAYKDEHDRTFPSASSLAFKVATGDKYKIIDVTLPDAYIAIAETKLAAAGQTHYDDNSQPRIKYGLAISRSYLEKLYPDESAITNVFGVGDYIRIVDTEIGVDKLVRIQSFDRDVMNPYVYTLSLSDTHEKSLAATLVSKDIIHDKEISVGKINNINSTRQGWRANRDIFEATFDDDGNYYTDKIKPLSIDTKYLSVGAKAQQFQLINAVLSPNHNGNPLSFSASACILAHYAIDDTQVKMWNIDAHSASVMDSGYYYLYAVCLKNGNTGSFLLSQSQYRADDDMDNYYFIVGILHGVDTTTNTRMLSLSYGFSMINGRFITTGRIQSSDGNTYFDLDDSEIGGRIVFARGSQEVTLSELGQESMETKNYIDNDLPDVLQDIYDQLDGLIEQFFETYDPTLSNAPASTWTTTELKESHLGDLFYNTTTGKVFRFVKEAGAYKWQELSDSEVAQALALANDALALAQTKRRVFIATPTTPYDVGDLWVDGTNLLRCATARASGTYTASDWVIPVIYDNTKTVIDGGVVTSGTIQLAGDNDNIKAGITGEGTTEQSIRLWAGAAFGNRANAPFRVDQSGKVVATNAVITGELNAIRGVFANVRIDGSSRSPFVAAGSTFDVNYNDNVAMISSGGGWASLYSLPWDISQSGRIIRITNYRWGAQYAEGYASINAPSGKYFYENGIQVNELKLSRECVELLGYGTSSEFYGWIVLNRINLMTINRYGRSAKFLAMGTINGTNSDVSFGYVVCYDGTRASSGKSMSMIDGNLVIYRVDTGRYRLTVPNGWFGQINHIFAVGNGVGYVYGSTSAPNKVSINIVDIRTIEFICSDDATVNDGSFSFIIANMNDWF